MNLTYGYRVAPGCCFVCRNSHAEQSNQGTPPKIIDFERDDPSEIKRHHVYVCESCVLAAYQMLDSTKVLVEHQLLADKDGEIVALTNEITRLMDEASLLDIRLAKAVASVGAVPE